MHSWKTENIFCLWFMVFPSGTLLVDSLNCPSRAKHTPHSKNQYTLLCYFFLSLLEYVFWWSVSLHYEGKWWGVLYYIPMAGIGFYFPEEYLCSVKTLIKNLQWVVKGLVRVAAAVTTVIFPQQELAGKQQQSFTGELKTFIVPLCTLRLRWAGMIDSLIQSFFSAGVTELSSSFFTQATATSHNPYCMNQAYCLLYICCWFMDTISGISDWILTECGGIMHLITALWHFRNHKGWKSDRSEWGDIAVIEWS